MNTDELTLDALRSFICFADRLNFTRAAEDLHLAQPSLHTKIAKLSATLGAPLYVRDGRRLELTDAGRAVAEFGRHLTSEVASFAATFEGRSVEPVVIAAGDGAHRYVLGEGIRQITARGGALRLLSTDTAETIDAVRRNVAHIGVTVIAARPKDLRVQPLSTYSQLCVMDPGHHLGRRRALQLTDLAGANLVLAPPGRPQRTALEGALRTAGVDYTVAAEAEGWSQMLHLVRLGVGVAIVNGCVDVTAGLLARPLTDLPNVTYSMVLAGPSRDVRVREVVETLRACAR